MTLFEQKSAEKPGCQLHLQAMLLRAAANEAILFNGLIKSSTRTVSDQHVESMQKSYSRFFVLYERAGGNVTPNFHLMLHAISQATRYGAPKWFATYVDEAFNGVLASIAKTCHKLTWAETVFTKLAAIEQMDSSRFAGFRK